jgi:hypothetical protein
MAASESDSADRASKSSDHRTVSTVRIRATPRGLSEQHSKDNFWNAYSDRYRSPDSGTLTPDEFEARIRNDFAIELRKRFISHYSSYGSTEGESKFEGSRETALRRLIFSVSVSKHVESIESFVIQGKRARFGRTADVDGREP